MKALCLSGAAARGGYEIGCLQLLINELNYQYDILAGVSVGAINCAVLSQFPKEQEKKAFRELLTFWENISTENIRKQWTFSYLEGFFRSSLYNSQSLIDLINSKLDIEKIKSSGRKVFVGATNMTTGEYKDLDINCPDFKSAVAASSAYPMGLNPIKMDNQIWSDGGLKHVIPISACINAGATEIDIIIACPEKTTAQFNNSNLLEFFTRGVDIMTDELIAADLKMLNLYNQLILSGAKTNKKYIKYNIIRPKQTIPYSVLEFNHDEIIHMIDMGYNDAKEYFKEFTSL